MATSSIIENITVNNPRALEEYIDALETLAREPVKPRTDAERSGVCEDEEETLAFMRKALAKHGIQL